MKLPDLQKWISGVEAQRGDLASASSSTVDNFDSRPRKRRRLDFDSTPRKRAKSDADIDYYIPPSLSLSRAVPCPRRATDVGGMAGQKRSMGPPESPSRSRRSKSRRSSDADAETITSRSSSAAPGTVTTGYRPKVLRPNGILFEHPAKTLPNCVQDALHHNALIDTLYTLEAGPEGEFCKLLSESHVIPLGDKDKGLYCTRGLPFKSNGLPRSDYPDCYCPVCAPKPDYAYGYNDRALDSRQQAKAQSPIYEPYTELYWPFLITEAKSQAMGKTCFQAANQCASGGTVAVNAIATLLDKAYSSPVEPEDGPLVHESERSTISQSTPGARQDNLQNPTDAIVFSVAIDSMAAELYVHWRSADKRTFHLQRIDVYLILRPNELIQLQDKLQRIIAWGMGPRLDAIRTALNILVKNPA